MGKISADTLFFRKKEKKKKIFFLKACKTKSVKKRQLF
jgi:hypothetical protein